MTFPQLSWTNFKKHRISLIAVLGTFVALLGINFIWFSPLTAENEDLKIRIRQQEQLIQKYKEKLDDAKDIKADMQKRESELKSLQDQLFQGTDPYQLAASLGDLLSTKAGPKLNIKTYQVLESKEYGLYREVHIRFNFMANIDGLYYFLDRIKNFQPAILIREMNIQNIRRKTGPKLVINVILAALMEKGQ